MNKVIHKNSLNCVFTGDLLFSETSKKLYMIIKLEKEKIFTIKFRYRKY